MNNIKFSDFRNYILAAIEQNLIDSDFKLSKSKQLFKKKISKSVIEIAFDFLDYSPKSYEYQFCVIIWIAELQEITRDFFKHAGIDEQVKWTAVFFEGDFIDDLKNAEAKFRKSFYNEVGSMDEVGKYIEKTISILNNQAVPLANSICPLQAFQNYCLQNKNEISKRFDSNELFISSLLAVSLKGKSEFDELQSYFRSQLDVQKSKGLEYKHLYFYLDKVNDFVKS